MLSPTGGSIAALALASAESRQGTPICPGLGHGAACLLWASDLEILARLNLLDRQLQVRIPVDGLETLIN
jgi:hypothetical protein